MMRSTAITLLALGVGAGGFTYVASRQPACRRIDTDPQQLQQLQPQPQQPPLRPCTTSSSHWYDFVGASSSSSDYRSTSYRSSSSSSSFQGDSFASSSSVTRGGFGGSARSFSGGS